MNSDTFALEQSQNSNEQDSIYFASLLTDREKFPVMPCAISFLRIYLFLILFMGNYLLI